MTEHCNSIWQLRKIIFLLSFTLSLSVMVGLTAGSGFAEYGAFKSNSIADESPDAAGNESPREAERSALRIGSGLSKSIIFIGSIKETVTQSAKRVSTSEPVGSGFPKSIEAAKAPIGYSIAGIVYYDADGKGIMDNNETGLVNWEVNLEQPAGTVINTAVTDANGEFAFVDLAAGDYLVSEIMHIGWSLIAPADGKIPVVITNGSVTTLQFANQIAVMPMTNSTIASPGSGFAESIKVT